MRRNRGAEKAEAEIARLRAEIATERARAERAESLVTDMLKALRRLEGAAGQMAASVAVESGRNGTIRGVAILGAVAGVCTEARAVIARAEGPT